MPIICSFKFEENLQVQIASEQSQRLAGSPYRKLKWYCEEKGIAKGSNQWTTSEISRKYSLKKSRKTYQRGKSVSSAEEERGLSTGEGKRLGLKIIQGTQKRQSSEKYDKLQVTSWWHPVRKSGKYSVGAISPSGPRRVLRTRVYTQWCHNIRKNTMYWYRLQLMIELISPAIVLPRTSSLEVTFMVLHRTTSWEKNLSFPPIHSHLYII